MAFVKEQKQSSKGFASQNKRARSSNNEEKQTIRNNVINVGSVKSDGSKQKKFKRATEESLYETSEAQFSVLERANEVAANLDPQFPSMVKVMLPSHVSGGFWLGLSKTFCIKHLPKQDTMFVLEDENGEKFETKYLVKKIGLSGGWRGFSIAHKLLAGDVLVFHLVTESKFKVEQRKLLETQKKGFKTRTSPFSPTHDTQRKVSGDHQKPQGCKRKRTMFENVDNPEDSSVKSQVEEIKAKIGVECPIFVKAMQPSNVASGFLLALPKQFCHSHLPSHDATIILQDESGEKYRTKFIVQKDKSILSSGWRRFCFANKLVVGDVLVFHLVRPLKFKVYIMGTHSLAEVEAAFSLLKFGSCTKQTAFQEISPMPLPKDVCQVHIDEKTSLTLDSNAALIDEEYNEEFGFNILEDVGLPIPATDFGDVENTKDFTILVNGVSINSCLSEEIRNRYYDLCCSQRSFLHNHLLESINGFPPPHGAYVLWEKTLDAFEILGMNVGFLRAWLKRLLSLSFRTKQALIRKSKEAKLEQARAKDKVITLESKYWKWKERMVSADAKIEALKEVAERRELFFQEEAVAPWG